MKTNPSQDRPNTLDWLRSIPSQNASRLFLLDDIHGHHLTFGALHESACSAAARLLDAGFKKGDRIAFLVHNSSSLCSLYFGCLYAGIAVVPINPILATDEIDFIIRDSRAKGVIVSETTNAKLSHASLAKLGVRVVTLAENAEISHNLKAERWGLTGAKPPSPVNPFQGVSSADDLIIVYTSGTTTQPKGVVHRIADMMNNGRAFGQMMGIGPKNRFFNILPMTYLGGYYNLLMLPYVCESSVVLVAQYGSSYVTPYASSILNNVETSPAESSFTRALVLSVSTTAVPA